MPSAEVSVDQAQPVVELRGVVRGECARILPGYGFSLFGLRLLVAGEVRPLLHAMPDFEQSPSRPARSGWPVLFPFPNRIRGGEYVFEGQSYSIPHPGKPHAIHGFALDAPWDVVDLGGSASSAWVTGRYRISAHTPQLLPFWPADAELTLTYRLMRECLTLEATVSNPDTKPLPFGIGFHPYFHLPLNRLHPDQNGDAILTRVQAEVDALWALDANLPTGEICALDAARDIRTGRTRAELVLDDVFTQLRFEDGMSRVQLHDLALNAGIQLEMEEGYRELVLYTPPEYPHVIAVEPYSQTTDAINLHAKNIDGGLQILAPGESRVFRCAVRTLKL